jgi:hypothetical protein
VAAVSRQARRLRSGALAGKGVGGAGQLPGVWDQQNGGAVAADAALLIELEGLGNHLSQTALTKDGVGVNRVDKKA